MTTLEQLIHDKVTAWNEAERLVVELRAMEAVYDDAVRRSLRATRAVDAWLKEREAECREALQAPEDKQFEEADDALAGRLEGELNRAKPDL
jgi:hypothetical protein